MYSEPAKDFATETDCFIYCAYNSHWENHTFELPVIPEGMNWSIVLHSADETFKDFGKTIGNSITLMPRSSMILIGKK